MHTPTETQQRLIDRIASVLEADAQISGAWLSGSLGKGAGDEFSDVDVLVATVNDPAEAAARYLADIAFVAPTLIAKLHFGRVLNCVTPDWERFDLVFVSVAELSRYNARDLKRLFSRGDEPVAQAAVPSEPSRLEDNLTEFFRIVGLGPVVLGRQEFIVALDGVGLLRKIVIDTMLELNGVTQAERGGVLKLNAFLTDAQREALLSLPPLQTTPASLVATNRALADIFIPMARAMCAARGIAWPAALERAALRRLS